MVMIAGCQKPSQGSSEDNTPGASGEKTFTATLGSLTKVSLGENGTALEWNKADKVSIFDGKGNQMFRAQKGGASTDLLGEAAAADTYYALFPYDKNASLDGSVIKATVPTEQEASAGGAALGIVAAAKTNGTELSFTPLTAVICFTLDDDATGVSSVRISAAQGALTGEVSIDCSGTPALTPGTTSSEVKITASEGSFKPGETYYVAVIPGQVKDLTVAYTVGKDELTIDLEGDISLAAGRIADAGSLARALTEEEKAFIGTWTLLKYGSRGLDGTVGQYPWINIDRGVPNPDATKGDSMVIKSDGSVEMNLGPNNDTYRNDIYEATTVEMTGQESWTIIKEGGETFIQFGGNAFPLFLGDLSGIGGLYRVASINDGGMILERNYQGDEGEAVIGIFLQPKGKSTYVHSFRSGDFGVTDEGANEVIPLVDQGITWEVSVDAASPFYYMNPNAGLMLGRAWGANVNAESAKGALMWTESFTGNIVSVAVSTARFAPESGEDKSAADLSVYIGGTKIGATYPLVNDMTEYSFTPADPVSGKLEIKWVTTNDEVNCFWVKSVSVVYEE